MYKRCGCTDRPNRSSFGLFLQFFFLDQCQKQTTQVNFKINQKSISVFARGVSDSSLVLKNVASVVLKCYSHVVPMGFTILDMPYIYKRLTK